MHWLAIKSRPDIAAVVSMLASMQSMDPDQVVKLTGDVWKYLAGTWDLALQLRPLDMFDDSGKVCAKAPSP